MAVVSIRKVTGVADAAPLMTIAKQTFIDTYLCHPKFYETHSREGTDAYLRDTYTVANFEKEIEDRDGSMYIVAEIDVIDYVGDHSAVSETETEGSQSRDLPRQATISSTGKVIVGFAKLGIRATSDEVALVLEPEAAPLRVYRLYVAKEYRGLRGIGTSLLEASFAIAKEAQLSVVWLGVWPENTAALNFYTKRGFANKGEVVFHFGAEQKPSILMLKYLSRK